MRGEIATRPIVWVAVTIAATVALVVVSVFLLLRLWQTPPSADRVPLSFELVVPGPPLESAPQLDLHAYREDKQRLKDSAGAGARRGVARIPVDDAMALLAASAPHRGAP